MSAKKNSSADIALFSLNSGRELAQSVADQLDIEPGKHEERDFEDGEHKIRPMQSVRGADVYVLQSLHSAPSFSVNDQLVRLLFFLGALRDAGARRLTAVIPYLCYARKDRRTKARDPVSLRYLAQLFEAMGIDCMVTLDVHNRAAFDNAFRCPTLHLSIQALLCAHFAECLKGSEVTVASPDIGGVKRAESLRLALSETLQQPVGRALMEKHRSEDVISGDLVAGEINGRQVLILDDLIAGGSTMRRAAEAFTAEGASAVYAIASHGVFAAPAADNLDTAAIQQVIVSNSVAPVAWPPSLSGEKRLTLDISPLLADAIRHLHNRA